MKKAIATLLVSILLLSALPFGVSAGGLSETAGKRDYAGLISRKDKYELYVSGSDESGLWGHHVYQKHTEVFSDILHCLSDTWMRQRSENIMPMIP